MPFPDRSDLTRSLLSLIADQGGEIEVRQQRVFERLADEYCLTPDERAESYLIGGDKRIPKWEQTVRVLQQELKKKGLFADKAPRGRWRLTPAGTLLARELSRIKPRKSVQPQTSADALRLLGMQVDVGDDGVATVRSSLPTVGFRATLLSLVEGDQRTIPRSEGDLLVVGTISQLESLPFLPEGAMTVAWEVLSDVCMHHQDDPIAQDVLADAFRASADDGGQELEALARKRRVPEPVLDVARLVLNHVKVRCELDEDSPIVADQVFWFLTATPDVRAYLDRSIVVEALNYLATPEVGALRRTEEGYMMVLTPDDAARRLELHR